MASRGHMRTTLEGRSAQAPGLMRHGRPPTLHPPSGVLLLEPLSPLETMERKIHVQSIEMERLTMENHRLATTHVALRQDLINAQQEVQQLNAHVRSIQTESDIQLRVLLDKIAKYEVDIRAGESVKMDLQKAHGEAHKLVIARQELIALIERKNDELQKARLEAEKLPLLHAELDGLLREHQRLRTTFEYVKSTNVEQVRQLQAMEKNLMSTAGELEKLRTEVAKAEKNANEAPYTYVRRGSYMQGDPSYISHIPGGPYVDGPARIHAPMGGPMPVGEGVSQFSSVNSISMNGVAGAAAPGMNWGAIPYDPSRARR
ncbi:hypothetical protein MLD38_040730 [Melastoma candidum]|nr:hypothetical protein MLD38_040730 [Melastoma candidum]